MGKHNNVKRLYVDLNHPADFHLFKRLMNQLKADGWKIRISARDKDRLNELLDAEGLLYLSRGKGSNKILGKYFYGIWLLLVTLWRLILFRPKLTLSLSSPYLIVSSWLLNIPTICYDDNDQNPKLRYFLSKATIIISPLQYKHRINRSHHRLPVLKELAYICDLPKPTSREGVFIRITRTDTIHHSAESELNEDILQEEIKRFVSNTNVYLSVEKGAVTKAPEGAKFPHLLRFHEDLNNCRAFWGNSATMAAEASLLGLKSIFVSAELPSCLQELEEAGLLLHFHPSDMKASFAALETESDISGDPDGMMIMLKSFIDSKIDLNSLFYDIISHYPRIPEQLQP